jgi:[methyl-Co(III) methanol-specific corrinoid protein]:coenzyme M methyltransferase
MSTETMTAKDRVIKFLQGEEIDRPPVFSGMGNVIKPVLDKNGLNFARVHRNPDQMATAASGSFLDYGFECAVIPFDLAVEAEAMGAVVNYYDDVDGMLYPTIKGKCVKTIDDIKVPDDLSKAGRIPIIVETIGKIKEKLGDDCAVGVHILGPFTMLGQMKELDDLLEECFIEPEKTNAMMERVSSVIVDVFKIYKEAGADYLILREMGATSDVLSPNSFKNLVKPHLIRIIKEMPQPNILHICGNTNFIVKDMVECGADAISVDQKNNTAESREKIGDNVIMCSGFDPIAVLHNGKLEDVKPSVLEKWDGASAVMPGCDLWPDVTSENMQAMVSALKAGRPDGS